MQYSSKMPSSSNTNYILLGTRIAWLKVIFKLPDMLYGTMPAPPQWPKEPLAYVEWYSKLKGQAKNDHNMYLVTVAQKRANNLPAADIISLSSIRQSCQLVPCFGSEDVSSDWTNGNVLDMCSRFLLNNWASKYAYQTLW